MAHSIQHLKSYVVDWLPMSKFHRVLNLFEKLLQMPVRMLLEIT